MFKIVDHKQVIEKICRDLRVKRLDLVGSASRGDFQLERSDIDVLVEFDGLDRLFDRYFELKIRLEQQLGRQVDVIQDSAVKNPYVRKSLNRDRMRIYGS
ncbi:MAG: nucleotidyltransferase domain-containing protein [Desulfomonile tiedjei]|uniref:Nucleotidyltransferase domain-containing protein n=1 Tax=Desulfomonile tiedjei TaxID=2358 RepID=A0A9D6V3X8_9BACT|nr:nucleotidyltransferase domain-containing protein [Desulfomonile tiedjei]